MNRRLITSLFAACISLSAWSQDIIGVWSGSVEAGMGQFELVFHFSKDDQGKLVCTLDSPEQDVSNIRTIARYLEGGMLYLTIPSLKASYKAQLKGEKFVGEYTQMGMVFDLNLKRKPQQKLSSTPQEKPVQQFMAAH